MSLASEGTFHLTEEIVLEIHAAAIQDFGGCTGIRDLTLLESAIAAPQATIGGNPLHSDLVEIGAAYLFHLCCNHPFIDGNKRTALGACLVCLRLNGVTPRRDGPEWEALVLDIAGSRIDREETSRRLRKMLIRGPGEKS